MGQSQVSQRVHMGSVVQAPCSSAAPSSRAIGHGLGNASLSLSFRRRASPLRPTTARSELVVPSPHQQSRLQCRKPGRPAGRDNFRDHRSHWVAAAVELHGAAWRGAREPLQSRGNVACNREVCRSLTWLRGAAEAPPSCRAVPRCRATPCYRAAPSCRAAARCVPSAPITCGHSEQARV